MSASMHQVAPYPQALRDLVVGLEYRDWTIDLVDDLDRQQGSRGLTLRVLARVQDSVGEVYPGVKRGDPITVSHTFIVPAASYNRASWMRWLLDRILDVESHEACEYFRIDGERVFAPHHSDGENPYTIWMLGDAETASKRSGQA